ncbi:hypothetical protein PRIC2_011923 [Phytophthora ramorum]
MHPLQDDVVQLRSKVERGGLWQRQSSQGRLLRRAQGRREGGVRSVVGPAKLSFFSAHHNSIVALLGALQIGAVSQVSQYSTMLAFEAYEDKVSHEVFTKRRYENEEVFYAGHTQDSLCPLRVAGDRNPVVQGLSDQLIAKECVLLPGRHRSCPGVVCN